MSVVDDEDIKPRQESVVQPRPSYQRRIISWVARPSSIFLVLTMLGSAVLMLIAISRATEISVYDETTHADFVYQLQQGEIPYAGSVIAPEILNEWSCRGSGAESITKALPPCDSGAPPSAYPARGENYNASHPPLYYAVTAVLAKVVAAIRPGETSLIADARITGILWLWAAMIAMFAGMRKFGFRPWWSVAGAAMIPLIPSFAVAATTVSNDAPAALGGALAIWLLARIVREKKYGFFLPALFTFLITATKVMSAVPFIGVAAVCLVLAFRHWQKREIAETRRLILTAVSIGAAIGIAYLGWTWFQSGRGVPGWDNPVSGINTRPIDGSPFDELLTPLFTPFASGPLNGFGPTPHFNAAIYGYWIKFLGYLLMATPLAAIAMSRPGSMGRLIGWVAIGLELIYPHIVEINTLFALNEFFPTVAKRYGITILPLLVVALLYVASRRNAVKTISAVYAFGAVATVTTLAGIL